MPLLLTLNIFQILFTVSIANFEHEIVRWIRTLKKAWKKVLSVSFKCESENK